jgi:zinc protease
MKKVITFFFSTLFILSFISVFGQTSPPKIPFDGQVKKGVLDNGMTYYVRKNIKPENRAELRLALKAGSMQEEEDQRGLAHFIEHMCFNGTTNFEKSELVDYLESVGSRFGPDLNAYTSFDETVYMLQVRTDSQEIFDKGLLIIHDWANEVAFEHEEIDKERGVIMSEWRSRLSPDQRMFNKYFPVIYEGSRYAERLPIGQTDIIENAPYSAFKRFYNDWYRPDLMAVIAVGDFDVETVEKQIKDLFGKIPARTNTKEIKKYQIPRHEDIRVAVVSDKEASFTNVSFGIKHDHAPVKNLTNYRQTIVNSLYNRMLNARLDEISQEADPPYMYAGSGYSKGLGDLDEYNGYAMVPEGGAMRALDVLLTENERVLQHGFNESELERAKKEMLNRVEKAFKEQDKTESMRIAMQFVYHFLKDSPTPDPEQKFTLYSQYLPTISIDEINQLAKKWLTKENRSVSITGPEKEGVPLPEVNEIKALMEEIQTRDIDPYVDNVKEDPLVDESLLSTMHSPTEVSMNENINMTEWTYPNGLKVVLKHTDFKNDEILLKAVSKGGTSLYDNDKFFKAYGADRIVDQGGAGAFTNIELQKKLKGQTVSLTPFIGTYSEGMNGSCSPKDLETMFQLIYLYFTQPVKSADAMSAFVSNQKAIFTNLRSNPQYYFMDYGMRLKYQDHPRAGIPRAEDMDLIDLDIAYNAYKERFADAGDFTLFFVGNFDPMKMAEYCGKYLGNLPSKGMKESWKDTGMRYAPGKVTKEFSKGEAPKTYVDITYHGDFDWKDEQARFDFYSMIQLMRIKLREELREDKGGVYGVRVSGSVSQRPVHEYSTTISFNAEPERAEELITAAKDVIQSVIANGAEEKDLTKVKEIQLQEKIKSLQENRYWLRYITRAWEDGTDPANIRQEYLQKYIDTLSSDSLKNMAKKVFNEEQMIQIVMHPGEKPKE